MALPFQRWEFRCQHCSQIRSYTAEQIEEELRSLRFLRRSDHPEPDTLLELAHASIAQGLWPACEACGEKKLAVPRLESIAPDSEWNDSIPCENCGAEIPSERLELFPDSRICMRCQKKLEKGEVPGDIDYCPHCGDILQLRLSARGATSYKRYCPACKKQF
jgi:Prokaryotic dksA/traR C4-type zinc finger